MVNFDSLLESLHGGESRLKDNRDGDKNIIIVDDRRKFQPSSDFNTTIAYQGDINSQIITFKLPRFHDEHDLSGCEFKEIKWKNLSNNQEDTSSLKINGEVQEKYFYVTWEAPPEMCSAAGKVEVSISMYDKVDGYIAFSWNTASYSGLSIGASTASISHTFPTKSEILVINKETKNIVAPVGYNNTICTMGDIGIAHVYFLVNRYLGADESLDVLGENLPEGTNVSVSMYIIANGFRRKDTTFLTLKPYTISLEDRNKDGLVFIDWAVPAEITGGSLNANTLEVAIEFEQAKVQTVGGEQKKIIEKRWISNPYRDLKINKSIVQSVDTPGGGATEEYVYKLIDEYFEVHEITWEA